VSQQTRSLILKLLAIVLVLLLAVRFIGPILTSLQLIPDLSEFYTALTWAIVATLIALVIGVALGRLRPKVVAITTILIAMIVGARYFFPVPLPHIQLPGEVLWVIPGINFGFTNTMLAILTTDALLIVLALMVRRRIEMVPSLLQNIFEAVIEFWQDTAHQLISPDLAKRWLPLAMTMFFLVGLANWSELIPGYDTVGWACNECPHVEGTPEIEHTHFSGFYFFPSVFGDRVFMATARAEEHAAGEEEAEEEAAGASDHGSGTGTVFAQGEGEAPESGEAAAGPTFAVVPFYRAAATDLNFTLGLALIAFIVVQVAGIRALGGWGYLSKFLNFKEGGLGIFVGLVEAISELSRIISFSFRLFGNVFAGQILLFVIPFLLPFLVPLVPIGLELFVGLIQGYVFAVLTLAFMGAAVTPHHHEEDHH
jgi:F-type H+-transporting ATPase subunit a